MAAILWILRSTTLFSVADQSHRLRPGVLETVASPSRRWCCSISPPIYRGSIQGFGKSQDPEALLVLSWPEEVWAQACLAHHLRKTVRGLTGLKTPVDNLEWCRYRACRPRWRSLIRLMAERTRQSGFGVRGLVVDHAGCFAREVGVVVIEAILVNCMFVVARKDHGLANAVAIAAGAALGHQY